MDIYLIKRHLVDFAIGRIFLFIKNCFYPIKNCGLNNEIICDCKTSKRLDYHISVNGNNNKIFISPSCQLYNTSICISGDNNELFLDDEVKIQKGRIIISKGGKFKVKHNTTFQEIEAYITEEEVKVGYDCLFSYGIIIRNYDGHKIICDDSGEVYNKPGKIIINDHVWISQNVIILNKADIGSNTIIGCNAVVTKKIANNCVAVGIPAKEIRRNRNWIRH